MYELARSHFSFSEVYLTHTLMLVYRLVMQSPECDPFFHNALEAEQAVRVDDPPNLPMCWRSGQGRAAVWTLCEERDRTYTQDEAPPFSTEH